MNATTTGTGPDRRSFSPARTALDIGRFAAIALGFSIPVSTALDNMLLALLVLCFLVARQYRDTIAMVRANPVLLSAVALYGVLLAGVLLIDSDLRSAGEYLAKYIDLLCIPIIASFFREPKARRLAIRVLAFVLAGIVVLSFLLQSGLVPRGPVFIYNTTYPVVFKHQLTHSLLIAFGSFLFLQLARDAGRGRARWMWAGLAGLALINIIWSVPGLTSYVVVGVLTVYTGYAWQSWKGVAGMTALAALALVFFYAVSAPFQNRIDRAFGEIATWKADTPAKMNESTGTRIEFYRNSLNIIIRHPVSGTGTGSFSRVYADEVRGTQMLTARNPHSEYLSIAVQTGLIGVAFLFNLFWQHWRLAPRLASRLEHNVARGLVLTIAVGSLFNSFLLDHAEGLLFAWLTAVLYSGLQSRVSERQTTGGSG